MSKLRLTAEEKDEIRRLTQFANRRIKAAHKVYSQAGKDLTPNEVVGGIQDKSQWHTSTTPLSRSVVFEDRAEYRRKLAFLRSFENRRPTIKTYTEGLADRTITAMETGLEMELPSQLKTKIAKMTAPEIDDFWKSFERRAVRMEANYESNQVMGATFKEYFQEDYDKLLGR